MCIYFILFVSIEIVLLHKSSVLNQVKISLGEITCAHITNLVGLSGMESTFSAWRGQLNRLYGFWALFYQNSGVSLDSPKRSGRGPPDPLRDVIPDYFHRRICTSRNARGHSMTTQIEFQLFLTTYLPIVSRQTKKIKTCYSLLKAYTDHLTTPFCLRSF